MSKGKRKAQTNPEKLYSSKSEAAQAKARTSELTTDIARHRTKDGVR